VWRETTKHERNLKIWLQELDEFVPGKVLDFHMHVWNKATMPAGQTYDCVGHAISGYDFEQLNQDLAGVYPGRQSAAVCFGMPSIEYDLAENNRYVAAGCDHRRFFALRLIDPSEDPAKVRQDVLDNGFLGFKPYLDYVRKDDSDLVEIHEMLPADIMRIADELSLIVMLHIPRKDRLADPLNQKQIVELCTAWPRAKIILAHIGRAYFLQNVVGHLDNLKGLPNLYFDLTMVSNWEVLEYTFQQVPHHKIIHGTDTPLAIAPGTSVEINNQYTYITPTPWSLSISDEHGKIVFTSFLYEQLRAMKKAVQRLGLPKKFVEDMFYNNGMELLNSAIR